MSKTGWLAIVSAAAGVLLVVCGFTVAFVSSQANPAATPVAPANTATIIPAPANLAPLPPVISGIVTGTTGPLAGAIVQIQGTENITRTTETGAYRFDGLSGTAPIIVTAWSEGHYIGWTTVDPAAPDWQGSRAVNITLNPLPTKDNSEYAWFAFEDVEGSAACGLCHREYPEWQADAHSQAAVNRRFLSMYTGTDINGTEGQPVVWGSNGVPLPPDPDKPFYGPGFRRENPGRAGNCATCHTPAASKAPNNQNCAWSGCHTDLTIERSNGFIARPAIPSPYLSGDAAEGISCEFCHKIGAVILDPETNLPLPDMPGILSYRLYRPADESEQVFFGTLVDVSRQDSYLPLLSRSEFCAGCHYGVFGGVVGMGEVKDGTLIYNSYGEWLDSPYSNPAAGKTCQDCHMPVSDADWFVLPERGGVTRDYATLHNHTMTGAADETLLQNSVTIQTDVQRTGDNIQVEVSITNDKTGHHVPTDSPLRSMILVVEAVDASGQPLLLRDGPLNPAYSGNYGGLPGKTFAKVLRDEWTGESPTGAIWRPVTVVEDTRLAALATDTTRYIFNAPTGEAVTVNVRLYFRRAFYELMQQKGWNDPDILMEHTTIPVPGH